MKFFLGSTGPNFFSLPGPANGGLGEGMALNVLRSVQFSYLLLKAFRSTNRALKDLDVCWDEGGNGGTHGRLKWRPTGRGGGLGNGNVGLRGRCPVSTSSRYVVRSMFKGPGRRTRCSGENVGGNEGKAGREGFNAGSSGRTSSKRSQGGKRDRTGLQNSGRPSSVTTDQLGWADDIAKQLNPMKGVMKVVKLGTSVVSGLKTATVLFLSWQESAGGVLLGFGAANGVYVSVETARLAVKGAKISKEFAGLLRSTRQWFGIENVAGKGAFGALLVKERFLKGLKMSDGALTLVKLTQDVGGTLQAGLTNWELMSKGYDASNGAVKVVEAVLGMKGGLVGIVGKGFTALKGVAGGLGMSAKLVKAIMLSKTGAIAVLQGFGLTKTVKDVVKAAKDGNKMFVKQMTIRDGSKDANEDLVQSKRLASARVGADGRTLELAMTCVDQSVAPATYRDGSSSLLFSLASVLIARCRTSDVCDPSQHASRYSDVPSYNMFMLGLPS